MDCTASRRVKKKLRAAGRRRRLPARATPDRASRRTRKAQGRPAREALEAPHRCGKVLRFACISPCGCVFAALAQSCAVRRMRLKSPCFGCSMAGRSACMGGVGFGLGKFFQNWGKRSASGRRQTPQGPLWVTWCNSVF